MLGDANLVDRWTLKQIERFARLNGYLSLTPEQRKEAAEAEKLQRWKSKILKSAKSGWVPSKEILSNTETVKL